MLAEGFGTGDCRYNDVLWIYFCHFRDLNLVDFWWPIASSSRRGKSNIELGNVSLR